MSPNEPSDARLRHDEQTRQTIEHELNTRFAPEDDVLRAVNERATAAGLPAIQITPLQGKLLYILALTCGAQRILEIGALAGYSGTWLARALPPTGRLITLEVSPIHAEVVRATFAAAGLTDRAEVRVGPALESLPALTTEAPFDLIFIDADKGGYPQYLDWALRLSRPGTIIVADNVIRGGRAFMTPPPDESAAGAAAYNAKVLAEPRLETVALPLYAKDLDGYAISVVRR